MERLKTTFEQFLSTNKYTQQPTALFDPINYVLAQSGKRFRPILLLAAYRSYQPRVEEALEAAMVIEVFHNFTLLHDDIMDNAPIRRGQPTVHIHYGTDAAILSGDAMMISAYQWLGHYASHPAFANILSTFSQVALDVCRGQQMDMDFEQNWQLKTKNYLEMIRLKTAVLLGGALKIGALLGGANGDDANKFYQFGIDAGLAFQIQDDILDSFGESNLIGKQSGGDIIQNKKTFLLLKTIEQLDEPEEFISFMLETKDPTKKINYVKEKMVSTGALDAADMIRDDYYEKSLQLLDDIDIPENEKEFFSELALKMARRSF